MCFCYKRVINILISTHKYFYVIRFHLKIAYCTSTKYLIYEMLYHGAIIWHSCELLFLLVFLAVGFFNRIRLFYWVFICYFFLLPTHHDMGLIFRCRWEINDAGFIV